jgi:hypothetical protein
MSRNEAGYQPRTLQPLIRWAAFLGIGLLVARRLVSLAFPNFLPSSRWRPELWRTGLLTDAAFELLLVVLLLAIPVCIYFFRRRYTNSRELLIDSGAAVILYLTALLLL